MWMAGGPSQIDMFDYKPRLAKESGEAIPYEIPDGVGMDLSRLVGTDLSDEAPGTVRVDDDRLAAPLGEARR